MMVFTAQFQYTVLVSNKYVTKYYNLLKPGNINISSSFYKHKFTLAQSFVCILLEQAQATLETTL